MIEPASEGGMLGFAFGRLNFVGRGGNEIAAEDQAVESEDSDHGGYSVCEP